MNTSEVRDVGVVPVSNIKEGITRTDGKKTVTWEKKNYQEHDSNIRGKASKMKMCIVSCLG